MEPETLQTTQRNCKDCGAVLGPGRDDKLYCNNDCRTNYNNKKRKEMQISTDDQPILSVPEYITRIQNIILNNRSILESLCTEDKVGRLRERDLVGKGFNTKYFTSEAEPTGTGNIYRFCFEYGYLINEDNRAIIVCRKREVY
ncbi:hypothetical protein FO440_20630 [Mucilaginibacter corticis]|uniref:DUF2116 family Zn-ribbon domain-containing protein n=1 Tax=Mucilaginibacter corticis TaxID=2597670 RepID=A0A556MG60_9SPHI|nr:hypothetical protein [Mucilaginibacter corticis]TSJ38907.1 hypothetical protein FO440_20630 [Mucilaginibacter corticis]